MSVRVNRRKLLKDSAIVAGVAVGSQVFGVPALLAQRSPNSKLGMALIGTNDRGQAHYQAMANERVVAFVDIDDAKRQGGPNWLEQIHAPKAKEYWDFRKMFDELHKQIDAVFVATPDHTPRLRLAGGHRAGKHVYCEKPLTHDIYEARAWARRPANTK